MSENNEWYGFITVHGERLPMASAAVASGKGDRGETTFPGAVWGRVFGVLEGLEKLAGVLILTRVVRARLPFVT